MITISIAENQVMFREMLADVINNFGGFRVVYQARHGEELLECVAQSGATQILILDLEMPIMNGYGVAVWFKKHHPDTKILMLTAFGSPIVMMRLLKIGVRGFLRKDSHPKDLKAAMLHVMQEDSHYLQNADTAEILQYFELGTIVDKSILNDRELLFIKLACTIDSTQHIADEMELSVRMVQNVQYDVYQKLKVMGRVQMVAYAINNGILNL